MIIQACPFCSFKAKHEGAKGAVSKIHDHILDKHLNEAYYRVLEYDTEKVKRGVVSNAIWRQGMFQKEYMEIDGK